MIKYRSQHEWLFSAGTETGLVHVGKSTAGRLLDGREHNEMPEVRP
jgi:hypothetical protein